MLESNIILIVYSISFELLPETINREELRKSLPPWQHSSLGFFHEEAKIAMNSNDTETGVDSENQLPSPSWTDRPPTEAELQLESQPSSYHSLTSGDLTEDMSPETVMGSMLQQEMGSALADTKFGNFDFDDIFLGLVDGAPNNFFNWM